MTPAGQIPAGQIPARFVIYPSASMPLFGKRFVGNVLTRWPGTGKDTDMHGSNQNATAGANTGGGNTMTREPSTDRQLKHLVVDLDTGSDLICSRLVYPVGGATPGEIVTAMKDDANMGFLEPLVQRGKLYGRQGRKRVVLATFTTEYDGWFVCEIQTVTARFDDDSETDIPLT